MVEYAWGNLLSAINEHQEEVQVMVMKKNIYVEEMARYEPLEIITKSDNTITQVPNTVESLKSWESITFISTWSTTDTLYYVESEWDGQYTVSFGSITMKDLSKKELDVIVSLNNIPVIDRLFSVNSTLYKTLFREYKIYCQSFWIDPTSNPPYDFVRYIYTRLNDVYVMKNSDSSHLTREDQGERITSILMTNISLRQEIWWKLQDINVITADNRLNLSEFPK
jgi:hypothetical protein